MRPSSALGLAKLSSTQSCVKATEKPQRGWRWGWGSPCQPFPGGIWPPVPEAAGVTRDRVRVVLMGVSSGLCGERSWRSAQCRVGPRDSASQLAF